MVCRNKYSHIDPAQSISLRWEYNEYTITEYLFFYIMRNSEKCRFDDMDFIKWIKKKIEDFPLQSFI